MTTLALMLWPIVVLVLFRRLSIPAALAWSVVGGYLLLPPGARYDLPVLPPYDKTTMPIVAAALMCLLVSTSAPVRRALRGTRDDRPARPGGPRAAARGGGADPTLAVLRATARRRSSRPALLGIATLLLAVPVGAALTNGESLNFGPRFLSGLDFYDALSGVSRFLMMLLPFLVARRYLVTADAQATLLKVLVLSGLGYALLALVEVRLSPQLNNWIYGYYAHNFNQHIRAGGFRPMIFLEHGLRVGIFFAMTVLLAAALWRAARSGRLSGAVPDPALPAEPPPSADTAPASADATPAPAGPGPSRRPPPRPPRGGRAPALWLAACFALFVTLFLSKTLGAFLIALALLPVALLLRPRFQTLVAAGLALFVVVYPITRGAGLVPTGAIVDAAARIDTSRAASLAFRFDNEDILLDRAGEKPLFGWGGYSRNRVFDPETGRDLSITDGTWVLTIGTYGWVGYLAYFGLLTLPLFWMLRVPAARGDPIMAGLALALTANLIDLLPNSALTPLTWLIAGAMVGRLEALTTPIPAPAPAPVPAPGDGTRTRPGGRAAQPSRPRLPTARPAPAARAADASGRRPSGRRPSSDPSNRRRSQAASRGRANSATTFARPARPIAAARPGSRARASIARASPAPSPGATRRPDTPSSTSSGTPAMRVVTTGRPVAIASISTTGTPSAKEGRTSMSATPSVSATPLWDRYPVKATRSPSPSAAARASRAGRSGPSPTSVARSPGWSDARRASASRSRGAPFTPARRPTKTTWQAPASAPARAAAGPRAGRRSGSTPQCTMRSRFQCPWSENSIAWERAKWLMQATKAARATFSSRRQ